MIRSLFTIILVWTFTFYISSKIYKYVQFKYQLQTTTGINVQIFIELLIPFIILFLLSFLPFVRIKALIVAVLLAISLFTFGNTSPLAFIGL